MAATDVVKGFEIEPGRYVTFEASELERMRPQADRTLDVQAFVPIADVGPLHRDAPYHVVPDRDQDRAFELLRDAMASTERAALGWMVLRRRRHLLLLEPHQALMLATTLLHADEVVAAPGRIPALDSPLSERERSMAKLLVETLAGPFDIASYPDQYRRQLAELAQERRGNAMAVDEAQPVGAGVEALMEALEQSLQAARDQRSHKSLRQGRRRRQQSA